MDIIKLSPTQTIQYDAGIRYVGKPSNQSNIGLFNPYGYTASNNVWWTVSNKKQALECYRQWLDYIIDTWETGWLLDLTIGERQYLRDLIALTKEIKNGTCTALACHCVSYNNYQPVFDGMEICHAEILYKAVMKLSNGVLSTLNVGI